MERAGKVGDVSARTALRFLFFGFFWLRWVFVAVRGLSLVAASGGYSLLQCTGFSLRWLLLLQSNKAPGLQELWLVGCGAQAQ